MEKEIDLYKIYNSHFEAKDVLKRGDVVAAMREAVELALDLAAQYAEVSFEDIRYIEGEASVDQQSILNIKSRIK